VVERVKHINIQEQQKEESAQLVVVGELIFAPIVLDKVFECVSIVEGNGSDAKDVKELAKN
jgi:hypothetical protein